MTPKHAGELRSRLTGIANTARELVSKIDSLAAFVATATADVPPDADLLDQMRSACAKKKRYRTAEAAGASAEYAHQKGSTDKLRIYPCSVCSGFHLTKVELAAFAGTTEGSP